MLLSTQCNDNRLRADHTSMSCCPTCCNNSICMLRSHPQLRLSCAVGAVCMASLPGTAADAPHTPCARPSSAPTQALASGAAPEVPMTSSPPRASSHAQVLSSCSSAAVAAPSIPCVRPPLSSACMLRWTGRNCERFTSHVRTGLCRLRMTGATSQGGKAPGNPLRQLHATRRASSCAESPHATRGPAESNPRLSGDGFFYHALQPPHRCAQHQRCACGRVGRPTGPINNLQLLHPAVHMHGGMPSAVHTQLPTRRR